MSKLKLERGIYQGIKPSDYHALKYAMTKDGKQYVIPSKSTLKAAADNHAKWKVAPEFKPTPVMAMGSALDCLLLTPHLFHEEFIVKPNNAPRRPTPAQINAKKPAQKTIETIAWWRSFDIKSAGRQVISTGERAKLNSALKEIADNHIAQEILKDAATQTVIITEYRGVYMKCMLDIVPDENGPYGEYLCDLKRTGEFNPKGFGKIIRHFRYDWQAAFYLWMWVREGGNFRDKWIWIISDAESPHSCGTMDISQEDIKIAERDFFFHMGLFVHAIQSDTWDTPYSQGTLTYKPWKASL